MLRIINKRVVTVVSFLFLTALAYGQCSMCKATAENGSEDLAEGLNSGILYLMILPYVLIGGIVAVILVILAKKRKAAAQ